MPDSEVRRIEIVKGADSWTVRWFGAPSAEADGIVTYLAEPAREFPNVRGVLEYLGRAPFAQ